MLNIDKTLHKIILYLPNLTAMQVLVYVKVTINCRNSNMPY